MAERTFSGTFEVAKSIGKFVDLFTSLSKQANVNRVAIELPGKNGNDIAVSDEDAPKFISSDTKCCFCEAEMGAEDKKVTAQNILVFEKTVCGGTGEYVYHCIAQCGDKDCSGKLEKIRSVFKGALKGIEGKVITCCAMTGLRGTEIKTVKGKVDELQFNPTDEKLTQFTLFLSIKTAGGEFHCVKFATLRKWCEMLETL